MKINVIWLELEILEMGKKLKIQCPPCGNILKYSKILKFECKYNVKINEKQKWIWIPYLYILN